MAIKDGLEICDTFTKCFGLDRNAFNDRFEAEVSTLSLGDEVVASHHRVWPGVGAETRASACKRVLLECAVAQFISVNYFRVHDLALDRQFSYLPRAGESCGREKKRRRLHIIL